MCEASRKKNIVLGILHSQKGFSLSELLVTLILVGLISAAVAGGISMVARSYTKVVDRADAEQLLSTVVSRITDELSYAEEPISVDIATNLSVDFISGLTGLRVRLKTEGGSLHMAYYYVKPDKSEVLTEIPLIDDKLSERMQLSFGKIEYDGKQLFTVKDLAVKLTGKDDPIVKIEGGYKVARINS